MVASAGQPPHKRKWFELALRHLRVAWRLRRQGFADVAVFHVYHAYECTMSALIAARGYPVPPSGRIQPIPPKGPRFYQLPLGGTVPDAVGAHSARLTIFSELAMPGSKYTAIHQRLRQFLPQTRNDALYYNPAAGRMPADLFGTKFFDGVFPDVREFAREVWREIR